MSKHLKDLLTVGHMAEVLYVGQDEVEDKVEVWVSKPTSPQQQQASHEARIASSRRRVALKSEGDYAGLLEDEVPFEEDALIDLLMLEKSVDLRRQAYEEILHSDEHGSDWESEGFDLLAISEALSEIVKGVENESVLEDNEEYQKLNDVQKRFFVEVDARAEELIEIERRKMRAFTVDEMRSQVIDEYIDREVRMVWYETYRNHILFYAIRYPDRKKKLYFDSVSDLLELPDYVFAQLWDQFNNISLGSDDLKK